MNRADAAATTTPRVEPSAAPVSAAADIWSLARSIGAVSLPAYRRALQIGLTLDRGRAALRRVRLVRTGGDDSPALVLGALGDAQLLQGCIGAAGAQLQRQRHRALLDPSVAAPARLSLETRRTLDRLGATADALLPSGNRLLGDLAGTPTASVRALLDHEALFSEATLSTVAGAISLDDVEVLVDDLHRNLIEGFTWMVSQPSVPTRIAGKVGRVVNVRTAT